MSGWPDPKRPYVPSNPDVDGWHWLKVNRPGWRAQPVQWFAYDQAWDGRVIGQTTDWLYLGPCLTPAEVAAREAAAAEAMRAAAAECARSFGDGAFGTARAALAIAALPLPGAAALAEATVSGIPDDFEMDCVPPIDKDTADTLAVMGRAFAANDKTPG